MPDEMGKELEKLVKAGLGAVSEGFNRSQEVLEKLARKGEPLYSQAKDAVTDAAGKIRRALSDILHDDDRLDEIRLLVSQLTDGELEDLEMYISAVRDVRRRHAEPEKQTEDEAPAETEEEKPEAGE